MLRNQQLNKQILTYLLPFVQQQRLIQQCNTILCSKNIDCIRQGKIMRKLFDHRVSGSKKRWIPSNSTQASHPSAILTKSRVGKSSNGGGKSATRRMVVLNKLFMEQITSLMATGEISERIIGKGLQILRVKISQDFAFVNVYWVANGEVYKSSLLEEELQRCAGLLRHELSQLCLMGVVPRIKFVKDKFLTNMNQVETLLKNMDFGAEEGQQQEEIDFQNTHKADTLKHEFYGSKTNDVPAIDQTQVEKNDMDNTLQMLNANTVPKMRHDIFGLNHKDIMMKIRTKMRKSKQAWDQHLQTASQPEFNNSDSRENSAAITSSYNQFDRDIINKKLAKAANDSENFDAFLAQRREKRNTPERKKFRAFDHVLNVTNPKDEEDYPELMMSKRHRELFEAEDYLVDDMEDKTHK